MSSLVNGSTYMIIVVSHRSDRQLRGLFSELHLQEPKRGREWAGLPHRFRRGARRRRWRCLLTGTIPRLADLQTEEEGMSTERNRAASPRSRGRGGAGAADGADPAAGSTNPVVRTGKRREDGGRPRAQNRRGSGRRRRRSA